METTIRRTRRLALIAIGVLSALGALTAAWQMVVPESIGRVQTLTLVGLLALLVMPGMTLVAWSLERRSALRARSQTPRAAVVRHQPSPPSGHPHPDRPHRHLRSTPSGDLLRAG